MCKHVFCYKLIDALNSNLNVQEGRLFYILVILVYNIDYLMLAYTPRRSSTSNLLSIPYKKTMNKAVRHAIRS